MPKATGDRVVGGSVNNTGCLWVSVDAVGNDTVLAKITQLVADAQMRKPAVQAQADRVAGYFVPSVVVIAVAACAAWLCACAAGIIPSSLISGAGTSSSLSLS